nr:MAG: hypothetical protein [Caudoviricetes sp.]
MSTVSTRTELKDYCLRRLGFPLIEINVSDEQIEDRISDALQFYADYHYDATTKVYYKHTIDATDAENRYITVPDNIIGVTRIFPMNTLLSKSYMWDIRYQLILNNLWDLTSTSMLPYTMAMQHIRSLELLFVGEIPIRFSRHENKVWIDMGWNTSQAPDGTVIVLECYSVINPEDFPNVYNDRILKKLATALIKRQFSENLKKFGGISLPGGITLNGDKLYAEAVDEINALESEFQLAFEEPPQFLLG